MPTENAIQKELDSFGEWLKNRREKSDKTVNDHQRVVRQYINFHDELPPSPPEDQAYKYRNHLRSRIKKEEIKGKHANNHLVAVEYYYEWLAQLDTNNIAEVVEITRFKEQDRDIKCMTVDEYDQILRRGLTNYRDEAIFLLLCRSGMRVSEMCSLDIGDMLWSQNRTTEIRIKGNSEEIRYGNYRFSDNAKESIKNYLETRDNTSKDDPLFTSLKDSYQRLTRSGVGQMLERASERANLDRKVTPHMLRAYMITDAIRHQETDLEQVRELVNHKTIEQTAKYSNLREKDLDKTYSAVFD
jgi:site-specific recombinase XerD